MTGPSDLPLAKRALDGNHRANSRQYGIARLAIIDTLKDFLLQRSAVQMVADDPATTAELLLLVRMIFADGELKGDELAAFKGVLAEGFGIPDEEVPEVMRFLKDVGYETTGKQAADTFRDLPDERKRLLLQHLMRVAVADNKLHRSEIELIEKVAETLGVSSEQLKALV